MKHYMNKSIEYIDRHKCEIVKFAQALVRIRTVNPPGENYEEIVGLLEDKCRSAGLKTKRVVVPCAELKKLGISGGSKRISLIARWDTASKKTLHFNGHYDVVPVTSGWSRAPFAGIIEDGRLYGRGAEDMKGTIAAMVCAVEAAKRAGAGPGVNVELSFTPDEEIGGASGLAYLVKNNFVHPDYAVSEGLDGDFVSCGNKGALWLEVDVLGESCHASTPYKGRNAFEGMAELVRMLIKLREGLSRRKTKFHTKDAKDKFATLVLGGALSGGSKVNIVPDRASFTIDRRILPEERLDDAKGEILDIIRKFQKKKIGLKVRVKVVMAEQAVVANINSPLCRVMASSVAQVRGRPARLAIMPGATDLRFLIRKGIPALGYNAAGLDRCHADDEFIYIKSLLDTTKVFALLIKNLR